MTIAVGINKRLTAKLQSGLGVPATTGSAQYFRRVTSTINKKKANYKSNEIRPSQQRYDFRHGVISVDGTIATEFSPGSYQGFMGSALRGAWNAAVTVGPIATVTAAPTTGFSGTFTDSGSGWLTAGFKIGYVVYFTGAGAGANATRNFLITALTAGVMTGVMLDDAVVAAVAPAAAFTCTQRGKDLYIPQAAQTRDYWSIEHFFSDIAKSELFTDCVVNGFDIKVPASGLVTIDFPILGLNMTPGTAEYFVTPTVVTSSGVFASADGAVYVQGLAVGTITSLNVSVKGNMKHIGGVVGANVDPDIYQAAFDVDGTMTVLFDSTTMRDYFLAETEVSIIMALATSGLSTADVVTITMPRVKINDAAKNDGETGLVMTMPFYALENTAGGTGTATEASTIYINDSRAV